MELLNNPQIHSTFASLGTIQGDSYAINDECLSILEEIICKLAMEDHTLRTYRRAIGFGQNVKKDIVPLLLNAKDSTILDMTVRLMVNLTVPIECLLSVDVMSRTEIGRHTIYELNRLLYTSKEVFVDLRVTKAIIDHMKSILETDHKLSLTQCESINNCLLLFRNILHIPEHLHQHQQPYTSMQNQIIWNLFTQSIDKLLIHLMSCTQRAFWGVTIVQLIALMYKDQHVGTLQKLLNHWFEAVSHTESSEDNESNTSPPKQCSGDSSPMLTSDPTSDSSDNGSGKMTTISEGVLLDNENSSGRIPNIDYQASIIRVKPKVSTTTSQKSIDSIQSITSSESTDFSNQDVVMKSPESSESKNTKWTQKSRNCNNNHPSGSNQKHNTNNQKMNSGKGKQSHHSSNNQSSELSDCGYGTQVSQGDLQGNQESISTSSNDDDSPKQKPTHQKPPSTNQKQRFNAAQKQRNVNAANATTMTQEKKDARRKKLVKRSKSSIINMKGLIHHTPTDEDISNILKEFTVDFLLKGYGFLVQQLHAQLLTDLQLSIDTSHFFWLVTYFLKFAAQLELDLEHISSVLCFDIVSYLTYEGVNICEQLELISRQQGADLKPYLRRIHLVVTAIREFLQALEVYKRSNHLSAEDKDHILNLQTQICCTEDLRHLFVLLLRCYNPNLQSRQYLQDLIVTNHILLLLLDNVTKQSEKKCNVKMQEHIAQFATVDIMHQYGILLESFQENGEFVNDCCFTLMHHVAGELGQVAILFQPNILKTYSQIWETEYEICDDWSDLIEYVIHKFINTPPKPQIALPSPALSDGVSINDIWAQEELDVLYWYYVQSKKHKDIIGHIIKQLRDSGQKAKSRMAVIQQLLQQDLISLTEYDDLMKFEDSQYEREAKTSGITDSPSKEEESGIEISDSSETSTSNQPDDIKVLRDRLLKENKGKLVTWLQRVLLECCFIKLNMYCTKNKTNDVVNQHNNNPLWEPVPHHCILKKQSIPLVPYNSEQHKILVYQPFVLLLHKLGFHLPADANKLFVRIPEFWTSDILYTIAEKLGPIPKNSLKFDIARIRKSSEQENKMTNSMIIDEMSTLPSQIDKADSSCFSVQRLKSSNSIIRFTPEVTSTTCSQSWLQMVVQSKASVSERMVISHLPQLMVKSSPSEQSTSGSGSDSFLQPPLPNKRGQNCNNKSSSLKTTTTKELNMIVESDGFSDDTILAIAIGEEDSTILEEHEHEVIDLYETNSAASSLTRMYVSDEEDKHDSNLITTI
ncbi:protein timeless isoform X3 [Chironomus tepperi]|uniref:protein timeless isoform X3 n=1 Tax=Chironomus tepperi TaxID=113505 RepID=UPI00391F784E